ncbi:hypothetical protein G7Y79_00009g026710 [Physcia stellaris]|nr:hypothetical protein G7Y79_00009g026710 [Physcia stellaris]
MYQVPESEGADSAYQADASASKPGQSRTFSSEQPLETKGPEVTEKNEDDPDYSCQFAGDTLSILNDTDETTNEDVKILKDFDRQMSQLDLGSNVSQYLIDIMQSLPPHDDCWRFFQAFKFRVHPVVPILHLPTLERMMLDFWKAFPFSMHGDTIALLLAVTYCGLVSLAEERYFELSTALYSSYERLMKSYDFPADFTKSTLPLLQSYVLVNTCRASQTEPIASFGFLPSTVRVAQALKLHVEGKSDSAVNSELHRRLWWHLVYLDVEASLLSGLPNLIHEDDYSTKMPSELYEQTMAGVLTSAIGDPKSPMMIAVRSRWHWARYMRKWRKRPASDMEFGLFEETINDLLSNIPDTQENSGPRGYVSLQLDRAICYKPQHFIREKSIKYIKCGDKVLTSCRFYLAKFSVLSRSFAQNGLQCLGYEETLQTRQLLDASFRLSKGRSEKANLIYCLLAKLKTRTYERAGWYDQYDDSSSGCPIRNLSEAIQTATAPFVAETVLNNDNPEKDLTIEAVQSLDVPMDTAIGEEWDGFIEDFLEPNMIE